MQIRLLQALTKSDMGGTELMILHLVRGLDRSRFAPEISFLDGYGPITNHFQEMGILVHDLSGPGGPVGAMRRLLSLLERSCFDIVHLYGFRMSLVERVAARFCQVSCQLAIGVVEGRMPPWEGRGRWTVR